LVKVKGGWENKKQKRKKKNRTKTKTHFSEAIMMVSKIQYAITNSDKSVFSTSQKEL
jgi:hypothetical protein